MILRHKQKAANRINKVIALRFQLWSSAYLAIIRKVYFKH